MNSIGDKLESKCLSNLYCVKAGDCLWKIAKKYLSTKIKRPSNNQISQAVNLIYKANKSVIGSNRDIIIKSQNLKIPDSLLPNKKNITTASTSFLPNISPPVMLEKIATLTNRSFREKHVGSSVAFKKNINDSDDASGECRNKSAYGIYCGDHDYTTRACLKQKILSRRKLDFKFLYGGSWGYDKSTEMLLDVADIDNDSRYSALETLLLENALARVDRETYYGYLGEKGCFSTKEVSRAADAIKESVYKLPLKVELADKIAKKDLSKIERIVQELHKDPLASGWLSGKAYKVMPVSVKKFIERCLIVMGYQRDMGVKKALADFCRKFGLPFSGVINPQIVMTLEKKIKELG